MSKIIISEPNGHHTIPDISHVFARELNHALIRLQNIKGNEFDIIMDSGYAMVYYALDMCIEYQNKGMGSVPKNIVDEIWRQVLKAAKKEFGVCKHEKFNSTITQIFYDKIREDNIIQETNNFWRHLP